MIHFNQIIQVSSSKSSSISSSRRPILTLTGIFIICLAISLAGCQNPTGTDATTTVAGSSESTVWQTSEITETSATDPTSTANSEPVDLLSLTGVLQTLNLGNVQVGPYFYWSPNADYCLFVGYIKETDGQFTPGAYLYDIVTDQLTLATEGTKGSNYYMTFPDWSSDGRVTVPFYEFESSQKILMYDLTGDTLETVPVEGVTAAFSPDGKQLAFATTEGFLNVYNFSNRSVQSFDDKIRGFSPIWMSDSQRLLFVAPTGNNPAGLDYSELYEIRMLDLSDPHDIQVVLPESSYQSLSWIEQDELAAVISGMDDGYYFGVLMVAAKELTDLGETRISFSRGWDQAVRIAANLFDSQGMNYYSLLDQTLAEIGRYESAGQLAVSLLPDGQLLFVDNDNNQSKCYLRLSDPLSGQIRTVAELAGTFEAYSSSDGSLVFLYNQYDPGKPYILDVRAFYDWLGQN